jgi:chorismate synthase
MRVAAGAVARKVLGAGVVIRGALVQMGAASHRPRALGLGRGRQNPFFCPDAVGRRAWEWETYLTEIRKAAPPSAR